MVAIKDMEMPTCCVTYTSENDNYTACPFYKICEQRETIKTNYKPTDCPLVEIEERKVGKWVKKYQYGNDYCSECNYENCGYGYPKFCPNCGAEMVGVENE